MTLAVILFLMGFLRTLLLIVIFYYLLRFIVKLLAPVLGYQRADRNEQRQNRRDERRTEGDVRVENIKSPKSNYSKDEGEYVDFEEIDPKDK
jgi:hypothetical protein